MNFCIPKLSVDNFKQKLIDGSINPERLTEMTSAERREVFIKLFGESNAKNVNALFESKLLLKNQQQGIINWAKQLTGIKPAIQRDILTKVNNLTEALQPKDLSKFLEDIVSKRLGVGVSIEEAGIITKLAKETTNAKSKMKPDFTFNSDAERLAYGRERVKFSDYISDLKNESNKIKFSDLKTNPIGTLTKSVSNFAGLTKSLKASLDNSVIGRQGLKVLLTNPKVWLKNSVQSFKDIVQTFGGKNVMDEVRADILSRPNELKGLYKKEGLAIGVTEETYPTSLPEKIPLFGRAFKASENAFTAFQYRTRADLFDKFVDIADQSGADIKGIGKLANSLTGRGNLGKAEVVANTVNNVFFSPRFVKSNIDALTGHLLDYKNLGTFAKIQAAKNTAKIIVGIAGILSIADAVLPNSVEKDPRSADFGKIRVGDTRFDVSGGMSSLVTLAMRLIRQSTKSSITGKITQIDSGKFGAPTTGSVLLNYLSNKLSPVASIIKDLRQGEDFSGNKPTLQNELNNLLTPIPITNYQQMKDNPNSANKLLIIISDFLGIGTNTYSQKK